jgi:hypothetical protein
MIPPLPLPYPIGTRFWHWSAERIHRVLTGTGLTGIDAALKLEMK